ncbi:cation-transporting P-type ATPase [Fluoribacter gormanii]|uniref:cation-translocating P-type ATPase n=1 Tax=Fluoribacter gormanii TaxID=464 RepID=UPI002242D795|nr:cation-transporting P-type ATPase [Fluoribacter gormanii]MCW8445426.1 cation-transporting P-type ATPase [Fluoribacter gormanii]MCW8470675.1 cation-transporting P-type ATPase [Fluoribacter gormanii]
MKQWHAKTVDEVRIALAKQQMNRGKNELIEAQPVRWYFILARQFLNFLILTLIIAAILSFYLSDKIDALAILAIIIFNAFLGFFHELRAETTLRALKKMISPKCSIINKKKEQNIDVKNLIPGDCVVLRAGNIVPADMRIIESANLMINEAALTGESVPAEKLSAPLPEETTISDQRNMAFMGTHIVNGHGMGLVVAIGMDTELGRISRLANKIVEVKTPLQTQLSVIGRQFGVLAIVISIIIILIGIFEGRDLINMLMTGISLAVSAIPEGLPAVVTIALALGARTMANKKALLRHLEAAETLGAVSIICTDKTGTLTKNQMKVERIWTAGETIDVTGTGYEPVGVFIKKNQQINPQSSFELMSLLNTGSKCNHAQINQEMGSWETLGPSDEIALLVAAFKAGIEQKHQGNITHEFSFDSVRKRMSVIEELEHSQMIHVKGAPEHIVPLCTHFIMDGNEIGLGPEEQKKIEYAYTHFAQKGLRTLALARKKIPKQAQVNVHEAESNLTFLGIIGLLDPPRPEVVHAIKVAQKAGIKIIMITGDSPITAKAIATEIGLNVTEAVTSNELQQMSDSELSTVLKQDILFARTVPEDKLRIVRLLQNQGNLVAMTGDGVNDTPALKQADVGIAMGVRGTDVARSAADIVLLDDNFTSIIAAVEEGRRQYANICKFVLYLTSSNIGEVLVIFVNMLFGGPLILIPIQILWINLITDSATAISLSIEPAERDIMKQPPRAINQRIINRNSFLLLGIFGSYIAVVSFLIYQCYLPHSYAVANTIAFTAVVVMANLHTLNFRSLTTPISAVGWFSNKSILVAIFCMMGLQVAAVYTPTLQHVLHTTSLSVSNWGVILVSALPLFLIPELYKKLRYKIVAS